jgi:hypothetical protein
MNLHSETSIRIQLVQVPLPLALIFLVLAASANCDTKPIEDLRRRAGRVIIVFRHHGGCRRELVAETFLFGVFVVVGHVTFRGITSGGERLLVGKGDVR